MISAKDHPILFFTIPIFLSLLLCLPASVPAFARTGKAIAQNVSTKKDSKAINAAFPSNARVEFSDDFIPGVSYSSSSDNAPSVELSSAKSAKGGKNKVKKAGKKTSKISKKTPKSKVKMVRYKKVMKYALQYKGWRYCWGGRHPTTSFDCAGLVIHTYNATCGLNLNKVFTDAEDLYKKFCKPVKKSEAKPGDLVFWRGTYGRYVNYISHVGIYCGDNITYAAGDPIGYYDISKIKNIKKKPAKYFFGRLKGIRITKTQEFKGATLDPVPTTFYKGRDYELVYNYKYYVKKYPEIKEMYDGDHEEVLKHFVKYGMKEGQQAKKTFNVKEYRAKNLDLRRRYKKNYKRYYYHFMDHGFKQSRKTT